MIIATEVRAKGRSTKNNMKDNKVGHCPKQGAIQAGNPTNSSNNIIPVTTQLSLESGVVTNSNKMIACTLKRVNNKCDKVL